MESRPKAAARAFTPLRYRRQAGAFAIMFAFLIMFIIGICALATDVGAMYNRKVDLNAMADAVALAAARDLNGTAAGIAAARKSAKDAAERLTYQNGSAFVWDDAALSFGSAPARSGPWISAAGPVAAPESLFYAKVDTALLDAATGTVHPLLMPILSTHFSSLQVNHSAVAGRTTVNVTPIAVCAMSPNAVSERVTGLASNELVQYGFRRGVSYDLMQLNPDGVTPARFLVNPVIAPGVGSAAFNTDVIGQFLCAGTMWVPRLTGGSLRVSPLPTASPLASLSQLLNSRFDDYTGGFCSENGAPPDYNIKQYTYDIDKAVPWMLPTKGLAAAATTTARNRLETIADLPAAPGGIQPGDYGPLWAYAKAVKYAATEPASGYVKFDTANIKDLYKSGPTAPAYPTDSPTPYLAVTGNNYSPPAVAHTEIATDSRRVLNIPLLACPVLAGSNVEASVLGVGKFFMTVKAKDDKLIGEFGGLVAPESLTGLVELYP
jgi:hypothetical protein